MNCMEVYGSGTLWQWNSGLILAVTALTELFLNPATLLSEFSRSFACRVNGLSKSEITVIILSLFFQDEVMEQDTGGTVIILGKVS